MVLAAWWNRAAEHSTVGPLQSIKHPNADEAEAQKVADVAGHRYAAAARALAEGNDASFQRWRKVADATHNLVDVNITKVAKNHSVELTMFCTRQKLEEADRLAEQAQAADEAEMAESAATHTGKRKLDF